MAVKIRLARHGAKKAPSVTGTDNRAIEETAQEILRYYENAHPQVFGPGAAPGAPS